MRLLIAFLLITLSLSAANTKTKKKSDKPSNPTVFKSQDRECPQNKPLGEKRGR